MAEYDFDVIFIGAGPGGYVGAIRAAQLGLSVACVEARETLGGTCLNVGCIPSKSLLHGSELFEEAAHGTLAKFGVKTGKVELDLPAMQGEKAGAVKELTQGIEFLFRKNKVTWLKGFAAFKDSHTVSVAGKETDFLPVNNAATLVTAVLEAVDSVGDGIYDNDNKIDPEWLLSSSQMLGHGSP